jgi:hypothetical protein
MSLTLTHRHAQINIKKKKEREDAQSKGFSSCDGLSPVIKLSWCREERAEQTSIDSKMDWT